MHTVPHVHVVNYKKSGSSALKSPVFLELLGQYVDLARFKIARTKEGKPVLPEAGLHFSLAHSGELLVLGISHEPLGIDIEIMKDRKYQAQIAKKYRFSSDSKEDFYREWVAREAFIKLYGGTLAKDLAGLKITRDGDRFLMGPDFHEVSFFTPKANYLVAVCHKPLKSRIKIFLHQR